MVIGNVETRLIFRVGTAPHHLFLGTYQEELVAIRITPKDRSTRAALRAHLIFGSLRRHAEINVHELPEIRVDGVAHVLEALPAREEREPHRLARQHGRSPNHQPQEGSARRNPEREGGLGENDIYRSSFINGAFTKPGNLGPSVNTRFREFDPFVAPDHSYLIFASERPGGQGGADLYISFRNPDGSWSEARNMGPGVNSGDADFTPMLSPDGAYLFLTSRRGGSSDLYWVNARVIEELRPEPRPLSPGSPDK